MFENHCWESKPSILLWLTHLSTAVDLSIFEVFLGSTGKSASFSAGTLGRLSGAENLHVCFLCVCCTSVCRKPCIIKGRVCLCILLSWCSGTVFQRSSGGQTGLNSAVLKSGLQYCIESLKNCDQDGEKEGTAALGESQSVEACFSFKTTIHSCGMNNSF